MWGFMTYNSTVGRVVDWVNKTYNLSELLYKYHNIRVSPGNTFKCPYHSDGRRSAKLFEDNHFMCFAEHRQYTSYNVLRKNGISYQELSNMVPTNYEAIKKTTTSKIPILFTMSQQLNGEFKKGVSLRDLLGKWELLITYLDGV